jgi:hypothetical protein
MNDLQMKLYKTRWALFAIALVAVGVIAGIEKLFR